jgi:hypothetical protein
MPCAAWEREANAGWRRIVQLLQCVRSELRRYAVMLHGELCAHASAIQNRLEHGPHRLPQLWITEHFEQSCDTDVVYKINEALVCGGRAWHGCCRYPGTVYLSPLMFLTF